MGIFDKDRDLLATTKTILEIVRNFAVVTALGYLGKAMHSNMIVVLYYFTLLVFIANFSLNMPFPEMLGRHVSRKKFKEHAAYSIPLLIVISSVLYFVNSYIIDTANNVIEFQDQQHTRRNTTIPSCRFSLDLTGLNCVRGP